MNSQIDIEFEAQSIYHSGLVAGKSYKISAGVLYGIRRYIFIAQDGPTYNAYVAPATAVDSTFTLHGPPSIAMNTTEVFTLKAHIHKPVVAIAVEVYAPILHPGIMTVDKIRITDVGKTYSF